MKAFYLILLQIGIASSLFGQIAGDSLLFRIIEHGDTTYEELVLSEDAELDIFFYKKHFRKPYYFPDKLIDTAYKNETVVSWSGGKPKKFNPDSITNERLLSVNGFILPDTNVFISKTSVTSTYTYDSLSRLTRFSNSSCMVCSYMAYTYILTYNERNQVNKIKKPTFGLNRDAQTQLVTLIDFTYDTNGQLVELKQHNQSGKIIRLITLIGSQ